MAHELTGFWFCLEDAGFYYLRQTDDSLWWVGLSTDQGLASSMTLQNGLNFCNVFTGKVDDSVIEGRWADVPRGVANNFGTLSLAIQAKGGSYYGLGFSLQLVRQSESGGFEGSTWIQLPPGVLPGAPEEIDDALENILKCTTYWDFADAQYERETLHQRLGDAIKDSVVLFGTLAPPIESSYPYNQEISLDYFWDNPDNHQDCDVTFNLNVNLGQGEAYYPYDLFQTLARNDPNGDLSNLFKKILGPVHCELIMFARHEKNGAALRPGWAEMNGNSVLINGRPLNGDVRIDSAQDVTSLGIWHALVGSQIRVTGALAWDIGHAPRGDRLEIHPVYALDIITSTGAENLSGAWAVKDKGTCYIRHLPDNTIWFFWMPALGDVSFATVFNGALNGNRISGNWMDVPLGGRYSFGGLNLTVQPGNTQLLPDKGGAFSDQIWTKLYDTDLNLAPICAVTEAASGTEMMKSITDLRLFRDRELLSSARGRVYVRLLQEQGFEIIRHLRTDKQLRKQSVNVLREVLAILHSMKKPKPLPIPSTLIQSVEKLMSSFSEKASPALKGAIADVHKDLKHFESRTLLEGLKAASKKRRR